MALSVCVACASQKPVFVQLEYAPRADTAFQALPSDIMGTPVRLGTVEDVREKKSQIGANTEGKKPVAVTSQPELVKGAVRDAFSSVFAKAGFKIDGESTTALNVKILDVWVDEESDYHARAKFEVSVTQSGNETGRIVVEGVAELHDATLSEEAYRAAISNALLDAVTKVVDSQDLHVALRPVSPPPEVDDAPAPPAADVAAGEEVTPEGPSESEAESSEE